MCPLSSHHKRSYDSFSSKLHDSDLISEEISAQNWLSDVKDSVPNNPLRILFILSQQPSETGSGVYLREIAKELKALGHHPYVLAAHYRQLSVSDFSDLPEKYISTVVFDDGANSEKSEIKFPIPGMSLDMPYFHKPFHSLSNEMLDSYFEVWEHKIKAIVQKVRPHIIHVNHLWLLPSIVSKAAPWIPVVAAYHGSEFNLLQKSPEFKPLISPGIRRLKSVMLVDKNSVRQSQKYFGVKTKQIKIIGYGYNPKMFYVTPHSQGAQAVKTLLKDSGYPDNWRKIVLYVGKFADYKGLPYLIKAAGLYSPDSEGILTLIVGDGSKSIRDELCILIENLGLTNKVLLLGKVPYHMVRLIMSAADVFVLPSINEPFGLVLLEALACGIRGVAAARGGPPFFVPSTLLEKKLFSFIKPLSLLENHKSDYKDESRYVTDLAKSIQFQLGATIKDEDRQYIARSVQDQTWDSCAERISQVYFDAIQTHRYLAVKEEKQK